MPTPTSQDNTDEQITTADEYLSFWWPMYSHDQLHALEALLAKARTEAAREARQNTIGEFNQTLISVQADNPKLDKEVVDTAIWIVNGRMASTPLKSDGEDK